MLPLSPLSVSGSALPGNQPAKQDQHTGANRRHDQVADAGNGIQYTAVPDINTQEAEQHTAHDSADQAQDDVREEAIRASLPDKLVSQRSRDSADDYPQQARNRSKDKPKHSILPFVYMRCHKRIRDRRLKVSEKHLRLCSGL